MTRSAGQTKYKEAKKTTQNEASKVERNGESFRAVTIVRLMETVSKIVDMISYRTTITAHFAAYEATEDLHRPADRLEMNRITNTQLSGLPSNREEFNQWADHLETMAKLFFTDDSPLVALFEDLKLSLLSPRYFQNFGQIDWRVYLWKVHLAMREFFGNGHRTEAMSAVAAQLRRGHLPNSREAPARLLTDLLAIDGGGTAAPARGGIRSADEALPGGGGGSPAPKKAKRAPWEPAKRWAGDRAQAKKAVEAAGLKYTF